jgi:hypothetical protein
MRPWIRAAFLLASALSLLWLPATPTLAIEEEEKLGTWVGATSALRFSDRWSLFLQGEVRTWEPVSNLNEVLFRIGGHYDFSTRYMGAFGYVRVDTWPFTGSRLRKFFENRAYQEFLIKTKVGRAKLDHRFRLEQRWITTKEFGTEYTNRARYMITYTHPLNNDTIEPRTNFINVFNEIFVDFDRGDYWFNLEEADAGLNQNRLYLGGGRQLTARSKFNVGVLWQHRPKADFVRLVLGYSHNFDFR